jgi:hypothetical protein
MKPRPERFADRQVSLVTSSLHAFFSPRLRNDA